MGKRCIAGMPGFPGKMFVMYVHEPSLLTVICRGKTIKGTWPEFQTRLQWLMERHDFPAAFIETEINDMNGYIVSKTKSKSMLAFMNQMVLQLEYDCTRYSSYETISQDYMENNMMDYLYQSGIKSKPYTTPKQYWEGEL
jgi:hypothetical protein